MSQTATEPELKRFPLADAMKLAKRFVATLRPRCSRIEIAGSIRRLKPFVKDIEILFVSKTTKILDEADFLGHMVERPSADIEIERLVNMGVIAKRPNSLERVTWGPKNKLAIHCETGIPVDFFSTTEAEWFNALVVRTGPSKSNKAIATAALKMGWEWHAYGDGFTRNGGEHSIDHHRVESEADCFHFVNLPYPEPEKR
jgi:DNA polymerase/3'-5' exonuclease PolX